MENWIGFEANFLFCSDLLALSPSFSSDLLAPATTITAAPFSPAAESPHLGFHFDAADTSMAVPK